MSYFGPYLAPAPKTRVNPFVEAAMKLSFLRLPLVGLGAFALAASPLWLFRTALSEPPAGRGRDGELCVVLARDAELDAVLSRLKERGRIVEEIIAGRMRLEEAVARFRDLAPKDECYLQWLRDAYPAGPDEARYRQQVLAAVRAALSQDPSLAAVVLSRLEEEQDESISEGDGPADAAPLGFSCANGMPVRCEAVNRSRGR